MSLCGTSPECCLLCVCFSLERLPTAVKLTECALSCAALTVRLPHGCWQPSMLLGTHHVSLQTECVKNITLAYMCTCVDTNMCQSCLMYATQCTRQTCGGPHCCICHLQMPLAVLHHKLGNSPESAMHALMNAVHQNCSPTSASSACLV